MNRRCSFLVVGLCLGMAACSQVPTCGSKPSKPKVVRAAAFFGRVTADPRGWTVGLIGQRTVAEAHVVVGGRTLTTDAHTERLGYCDPSFERKRCVAFVGRRRPGIAAWVLLAQPQQPVVPIERGRLEVIGTMVWEVRTNSIVLSQGVELRVGRAFLQTLKRSAGLGYGPVGRQVAPKLYVDPRSGEVLDVRFAGCM